MKKSSSRQSIYAGFVVILLFLGAAGFVLQQLVKRAESDATFSTLQDVAKSHAADIVNIINQENAFLLDMAKKPEIVDAIQQPDNQALLTELNEKIKQANKQILRAELIPFGRSEDYTLSFAELDQVKRAEAGAAQLPEASVRREGGWQFILSVPVKKVSGEVAGVLFAAYDMSPVEGIVKKIDTSLGSVSLVQILEKAEPGVIITTAKTPSKINYNQIEKIGETTWHIAYIPNPAVYIEGGISSLILKIALGVILLAAGGLTFFVVRAARQGGIGVISSGDKPIQIASAKAVRKGGKVDAALASELATQATNTVSDEDFNEISDPLFQHSEVLEIVDAVDDEPVITPSTSSTDATMIMPATTSFEAPPAIFRDYDIRGNADQYLSNDLARLIGMAIGSEAQARGETRLAIATDGRSSSPRLKEHLIEGIIQTGAHVLDIGSVPSPVLYFVTETTDVRSGVVITASHNPAADNGFKIILAGKTLSDDGIQALRERIDANNFITGHGEVFSEDYTEAYIERITSDIALSSQLKVVVDCGNGIAGNIAPRILGDLGCDVVPLFCDVDGSFPNHDPDPSVPANLRSLIERVTAEGADLGIALDGDGDRLVAVTPSGKVALPDRLMMIYAKDVVARNPGTDIIFDVKCSRKLSSLISGYGGRPVMWKSGHAHIRNKMHETGAMLGGELSGHIFFKERWFGFDDGIYAAARLLEILTMRDQSLDAILASMPTLPITPEIRIPADDTQKFEWVHRLIQKGEFSGGKITTIDGLRVDFAKGWGLVRASNTSPVLTLRFEADNDEMLEKIKAMFLQQMKLHVPELDAHF